MKTYRHTFFSDGDCFFISFEKVCIFADGIAPWGNVKRHINSITIIRVQNQKRRKLEI